MIKPAIPVFAKKTKRKTSISKKERPEVINPEMRVNTQPEMEMSSQDSPSVTGAVKSQHFDTPLTQREENEQQASPASKVSRVKTLPALKPEH